MIPLFVPVLAAFLIFTLIFLSGINYVPMWDAGWYFSVLIDAVEKPFSPSNYNLVGHRTFGYAIWSSLLQNFYLANHQLLHLQNAILLLVAALYFYKILGLITVSLDRLDKVLLSLIFLFSPSIIANMFHFNMDYGVTIFLIIAIYFLLSKNFLFATFFGFFTCFSKEVGAAIYGSAALLFSTLYLVELKTNNKKIAINTILKSILLIFLPIFYYGYKIIAYRLQMPDSPAVYTETALQQLKWWQFAFDFNIFDGKLQSYLFDIFCLNFNWLLLLPCLLFVYKQITKVNFNKTNYLQFINKNSKQLFILILLLSSVYFVTRVRPFNHLRYVMSSIPIFYLLSSIVIDLVIKNSFARKTYLTFVVSLMLISNYFTIDPLSKAFFGTVKFGQYEILNISSKFFVPNKSHENFNRDELVYNFQFMSIQKLWQKAIESINPSLDTIVLGSEGMQLYYPKWLNTKDYSQSWVKSDFKLQFTDSIEDLVRQGIKTEKLYFIDLPPMSDKRSLPFLQSRYVISKNYQVEWKGYNATVYEFDV